jgi:hypothetical protein
VRHLRRYHTFEITRSTGNKMTEEQNVQITHMMIGNHYVTYAKIEGLITRQRRTKTVILFFVEYYEDAIIWRF